MNSETVAYALIPYVGDLLIGLLPLVCLYEALDATFPFHERALLWYVGVIAVGVLVLDGGVPAFTSSWSVHTALTVIGFVAGGSWWLKPRRRPAHDGVWAAFKEHHVSIQTSELKRRDGQPTVPNWW